MACRVSLEWLEPFCTENGFDSEACLEAAVNQFSLHRAEDRVTALDSAPHDAERLTLLEAWIQEDGPKAKRHRGGGTVKVKDVGRIYEVPAGGTCADIDERLWNMHGVRGVLFDDRDEELFEQDPVTCHELRIISETIVAAWDSSEAYAAIRVDIGSRGPLAGVAAKDPVISFDEIQRRCPRAREVTERMESLWCVGSVDGAPLYSQVSVSVWWALSGCHDHAGFLQHLDGLGIVRRDCPEYDGLRQQYMHFFNEFAPARLHFDGRSADLGQRVPVVYTLYVDGRYSDQMVQRVARWTPRIERFCGYGVCPEAILTSGLDCSEIKVVQSETESESWPRFLLACSKLEELDVRSFPDQKLAESLRAAGHCSALQELSVGIIFTNSLQQLQENCVQHLRNLRKLYLYRFPWRRECNCDSLILAGIKTAGFKDFRIVDLIPMLETGQSLETLILKYRDHDNPDDVIVECQDQLSLILSSLPCLRYVYLDCSTPVAEKITKELSRFARWELTSGKPYSHESSIASHRWNRVSKRICSL
mmetsp:Transcript_31120/g.69987  ORF Transcript_31120/g.69987 Transcript_31120/m.69987 type:complete len:534 (-) Transcript_31120:76-1677(-)